MLRKSLTNKRFANVDRRLKALERQKQEVPVQTDLLTAREAVRALARLTPEEVLKVEYYERETKNRKTVVAECERILEPYRRAAATYQYLECRHKRHVYTRGRTQEQADGGLLEIRICKNCGVRYLTDWFNNIALRSWYENRPDDYSPPVKVPRGVFRETFIAQFTAI